MFYALGGVPSSITSKFDERKWKIHRDSLITRRNFDPRSWAREAGQSTINEAIREQMHHVQEHDLKLVLLFHI